MKWLASIFALLALIGVIGVLSEPLIVASKYEPQVKFNAEKWRAYDDSQSTLRQQMIRDLIMNVLPGANPERISECLGRSATHEEMRRHRNEDIYGERDANGNMKRTGNGWYFDEYDWDLIYEIGHERCFIFDHNGQAGSPDSEYLLLRVNSQGRFDTWYIVGSKMWPQIVGAPANTSFSRTRKVAK